MKCSHPTQSFHRTCRSDRTSDRLQITVQFIRDRVRNQLHTMAARWLRVATMEARLWLCASMRHCDAYCHPTSGILVWFCVMSVSCCHLESECHTAYLTLCMNSCMYFGLDCVCLQSVSRLFKHIRLPFVHRVAWGHEIWKTNLSGLPLILFLRLIEISNRSNWGNWVVDRVIMGMYKLQIF